MLPVAILPALVTLLSLTVTVTIAPSCSGPEIPKLAEHATLAGRRSVDWAQETLSAFDAALIATDHDGVDLQLLAQSVPLIVDTRNSTRGLVVTGNGKIVKA